MFGKKGLDTPIAIRRTALDLLARREHTYTELQRKLLQRGATSEQIGVELDRLQTDGLLSNERFCEAYVHARSQRGFGPQRLREELRQRGVSASMIETTFRDGSWDWQQLAQTTFQKRFPEGPARDAKERARQLRFMQYRGFADFQAD
ncbi:MAG TPA: regulatory protein RecX [Pseudomonas xinjiangensis]|uniref:Regulatory protein RecX n=2 Tax=root TaxID=1 RepID=A0A7V1BNA8_9GAMM|nr:regulatory protein RecX [Halopseudomonas xinjiangensis]HEC47946.1 regulatory protein RecX [Halopseudomonas xinjiangensis]